MRTDFETVISSGSTKWLQSQTLNFEIHVKIICNEIFATGGIHVKLICKEIFIHFLEKFLKREVYKLCPENVHEKSKAKLWSRKFSRKTEYSTISGKSKERNVRMTGQNGHSRFVESNAPPGRRERSFPKDIFGVSLISAAASPERNFSRADLSSRR